jgi:hypothetical protein
MLVNQPLHECVHDRRQIFTLGGGKELVGHLDEREWESLKLTKMSDMFEYEYAYVQV